jgi:lipooligosaccharide transport system ATP-binding protein
MSEPVVHVEHATKTFPDVVAVDDLSFSVSRSQCFALLGPNGAGKTTMMKMLFGKARRDKRSDTTIQVFGYDPEHQELDIKTLSGMVPQEDNLDVELSVAQNLRIFARFYQLSGKRLEERIDYLLDFMELSGKRKSRIRELSGGMKRRLIIARALINQPSLLFLDEPTTGLDPQVRQLIWDKLRSLQREGVTILLTTHYMEEAYQLADTIIIMDRGKKAMEGNPRALLDTSIERYVLEVEPSVDPSVLRELDIHESIRKEDSYERILYYALDPEPLHATTKNLPTGEYLMREANLEDLFLKATGRQLHEKQ